MYENIDPKHCSKTDINKLNLDADENGKPSEPIDELFFDGKLQYAKSSW